MNEFNRIFRINEFSRNRLIGLDARASEEHSGIQPCLLRTPFWGFEVPKIAYFY